MRLAGSVVLVGCSLGALAFVACDDGKTTSEPVTPVTFDAGPTPPSGYDAGPPLPACAPTADGTVYMKTVWPGDKEPHALRLPEIALTFEGEIDCPKGQPLVLYTDTGPVALNDPPACSGGYTFYKTKPKDDLAYGKTYTLRLEGFVDTHGTPVTACQTTFTVKTKTVAIASDGETTLARDEDGTLWIWGEQTANKKTPADIPGVVELGGKVVAMSTHTLGASLAALADGTVWAWGGNSHGELGRGTVDGDTSIGKVQMTLPAGVTVVGVSSSEDHSLAVRSDGKVMAWGRNDNGELADGTVGVVNGTPANDKPTPYEIAGFTDVAQVIAATGNNGHGVYEGGYSLVLKKDGSVWGFGSNAFGAIDQVIPYPGPNNYDPRYPTPQATQIKTGKAISAGGNVGIALLADGTLRSWEVNEDAATGDGTCQDCLDCPGTETYVNVRTVKGAGGDLGSVSSVSMGWGFGLAVLGDGTVWGWGNNMMGQLGDGTKGATVSCNASWPAVDNLQKAPKALPLTDVVQAAAGDNAAFVLKKDGSVWAAGYNTNNKLGTGGDAYITTFTRVPGL